MLASWCPRRNSLYQARWLSLAALGAAQQARRVTQSNHPVSLAVVLLQALIPKCTLHAGVLRLELSASTSADSAALRDFTARMPVWTSVGAMTTFQSTWSFP